MKEDSSFCRVNIDSPECCSILEPALSLSEADSVQFEIVSVTKSDLRKAEIQEEIELIDTLVASIDSDIAQLDSEIDVLTYHGDKADVAVAAASGVIAGAIDALWVGEFSLNRAQDFGIKKINELVRKVASNQSGQDLELAEAVQFLEKQYPLAADTVTNDFGGGYSHHLRDFSHHPTPVGLLFSIMTQFTNTVYGTDVHGTFQTIPLPALDLVGQTLPEKFLYGTIHWFFHLVSDMAGSSSSIAAGSLGTGLPGPLVALLKEVSALPFFQQTNADGHRELSVWISKLFNGTLIDGVRFDLRTEIGLFHELGRQAVPVLVNECVVRGFYFLRRLFAEIRSKDVRNIRDLGRIDWKSTLPFGNRTIARMLTISTGTAAAIDLCDAAARSAGQASLFLVRVNFVGLGRFAFAVGSDIAMQIRKISKENDRLVLHSKRLQLINAKVSCRQASMWIEAEHLAEAMNRVASVLEDTSRTCIVEWRGTAEDLQGSLEICQTLRQGKARRNEQASKLLNDFADIFD